MSCTGFTPTKRMKTALLLLVGFILLKLAILAAIIYVAVHFIGKFW